MASLEDIIDIERYPVHQMAAPETSAVIAQGRCELQQHSLFSLPCFISRSVLVLMQEEVRKLAPGSHHRA